MCCEEISLKWAMGVIPAQCPEEQCKHFILALSFLHFPPPHSFPGTQDAVQLGQKNCQAEYTTLSMPSPTSVVCACRTEAVEKYTVAVEIAEGWDRDGILRLENGVVPKWRKLVASLLTNRALQNQKLMGYFEVPVQTPSISGSSSPQIFFFGTWVLADK
jgi:hypothetical protein